MGYNPGDFWQLTPYVRFPMIALDEQVTPLFGTSVTEWSKDDFAQFHQLNQQYKPTVLVSWS